MLLYDICYSIFVGLKFLGVWRENLFFTPICQSLLLQYTCQALISNKDLHHILKNLFILYLYMYIF